MVFGNKRHSEGSDSDEDYHDEESTIPPPPPPPPSRPAADGAAGANTLGAIGEEEFGEESPPVDSVDVTKDIAPARDIENGAVEKEDPDAVNQSTEATVATGHDADDDADKNGQGQGGAVADSWLGPSPYPAADGQIDAPLEELEVTTTRTLKRIDKQEKKQAKKEARKEFCAEKKNYIFAAVVLLVLIIVAVVLGVTLGGKGGDSSGGGGEDIPDDFPGPTPTTGDGVVIPDEYRP